MDAARIRRSFPKAMLVSLSLLLGLVPSSWSRDRGPIFEVGPIAVHPAPPVARELISWAVERYEEAGLDLPPVDVYFHRGNEGCGGYLGTAVIGQIELCVRFAMEPGPQRIVLHELAHVWVATKVPSPRQVAFLDLRGLSAWGSGVPWKERGREQAAEIIAWGLGDGSMLPMIEGDRHHEALSEAFRFLTGVEPINGQA